MEEKSNKKLYYTISEVAKMFDLTDSTLRFWEQHFPQLRPRIDGPKKIRRYQEKDIEQVRKIYNLVKVRGFKLDAAKKILQKNPAGVDKTNEVLSMLLNVREQLQAVKTQLGNL